MGGFNRLLRDMVAGLAVSVILAEGLLMLFQFSFGGSPIRQTLAAGSLDQHALLLLLGLVWLLAGAAGGAMSAALSHYSLLALPVGVALGLPLAFTAVVGVQPLGWIGALALAPVLGALLAARAVEQLRRQDTGSPVER